MKKVPKKNPWIAALLNLLAPGLGYIYAGRRTVFGAGLLLVVVIVPLFLINFQFVSAQDEFASLAWAAALGILFAYDAYHDVK